MTTDKPTMERMTRQRKAIMSCFEEVDRPLSPTELLELARNEIPNLGLSTVYRTLRALTDGGEIVTVDVPGESPRYESRAVAARHHHHFHCRRCDRLFHIYGCPGGLEQMLPDGFALEGHQITLEGLCNECRDGA